MGSWCCENLRDLKAWEDEGLKTSTISNEACKLYDATLRQLVSWIDCEQIGGIVKSTEKMIEAEPNSIMGRSLALGMDAMSTNRKLDEIFVEELNSLVKDSNSKGNEREKGHALAVRYFANGEMSNACREWENILTEHPNDLQAIKFAHDAYFFSGNNVGKLTSIERVIDKWKPTQPCFSYLYGMHAFGLEENEFYDRAEVEAKKALNFQRQDAWATHALAHCNEMQGKYEEGIKFMENTLSDWEPCWMIACHNFWHISLFYLEKGEYEEVLSIFDREIAKRSSSKMILDLVDAASLLSRLEMEGVKVGKERWMNLVPFVKDQIDSHTLAFNDAHISMIMAHADDENLQKKHQNSIDNFIKSANEQNEQNENAKITKIYGKSICEAIASFKNEDFTTCFNLMYPIKDDIYRIGGSNAQRDVFTQLILNSGLKSGSSDHKEKALEVLAERNKHKHNSFVADRILQRHKITAH